jgi:Ca-activated chloride channel family protein
MTFQWPWLLLLLLLVPLFIVVYIWILRRKRRFAVQYSSLSLIREALPRHARWRQHLPFAFFLLAATSLVVAVARPVAVVEVPLSRTTIILAMDVSRSMCATDIEPNRLTIAQEAALDFIDAQAQDTRISIVAFAGFAEIVVPPTNDKDVLKQAVENFTTSIGTAIGNATLKSLDAIAEVNDAVSPSGVDLSSEREDMPPVEGFYQADIIVVLTDGANTHGTQPLDAAQKAADREVRVYTIGFGSSNPGRMVCSPTQLGPDMFGERFDGGFGGGGGGWGGWGGGGNRRFLLLDEDTLQGMADVTGGEYYRAEDAEQLFDIFTSLPNEIVLQRQRQEISALFSLSGVIFTILAAALSLLWHRY